MIPARRARSLCRTALLPPHPACSFLGHHFYIKLPFFVKSFSSTPAKSITTHIPLISGTQEKQMAGARAQAGRGGGRREGHSVTARHLRVSWKTWLVNELQAQPSKASRWLGSCSGLDRRSSLGPDEKEFCSPSIDLQLSPCEGCSPRCLSARW